MQSKFKGLVLTCTTLALIAPALAQQAKISDEVVKIGVLTDMAGQFSHEIWAGCRHRG